MTKPDYPIVHFGDVASEVTASTHSPLDDGFERYIGLEHLDPESLKIRRWGLIEENNTTFTRVFRSGQVLFGRRRAYQRKAALAEFDGICSGDIIVMEAKPDKLLPELLPFIVQTEGFYQHALSTSAGSLSPRTKWSALAKYEFSLPPMEEQRRIAEILWAVEDAIEQFLESLYMGEVLYKAVLNDQICQDVRTFDLQQSNNGNVRVARLEDVCSRITDGTHQPPEFIDEGIPFFLVSNLASGEIDWNITKWVSKSSYEELTKTTKPQRGDVLYTLVGSFGVPILITWDQEFTFQRHIGILKPDRTALEGAYLAYFLESTLGKKQADINAVGNAQRTITLTALKNFIIPLPSVDEQSQIVSVINISKSAVEIIKSHILRLKVLKNQLLGEFISGNDYV